MYITFSLVFIKEDFQTTSHINGFTGERYNFEIKDAK